MATVIQPLCDCEMLGAPACGVPGVLAWMENGRVAPGARVERCDQCQRFVSDDAARAKLVELGLVDAEEATGNRTYTVHCMAIVRVTLEGIAADSHREAAELARERFDWHQDRATAEFVDAFNEFVVDIKGKGELPDSRRFTSLLKEITV